MIKIGPSIAGRSRATTRCVSFFTISCHTRVPHRSSPRLSKLSLHREMNEFPFVCISRVRFHIPTRPRTFRPVRWILIFNLELSGPTIFIPISFLLSNRRNIRLFLDYDRREENLFVTTHTHEDLKIHIMIFI